MSSKACVKAVRIGIGAVVVLFAIVAPRASAAEKLKEDDAKATGKGMAAIEHAARANKYLFVLFYKTEDEATQAMRKVFDHAVKKVVEKADSVQINVTDSSEKGIVEKLGVDRAPMPLVLALAPNGAVTGGFPKKVEEQQLLNAFATPCLAKCLKVLQEGKVVFLCIQNKETRSNDDAMKGVKDFKADARFAELTEIVTLDPSDKAEAKLVSDLQIDPNVKEATTVFLAPPGAVIGKFTGATTKEKLTAALTAAMSSGGGCCGGGSGGGCGPSK